MAALERAGGPRTQTDEKHAEKTSGGHVRSRLPMARRAEPLLARLSAYIQNNRTSIVNHARRHREGKWIATTSAEGASRLLSMRTAVLDNELRERIKYEPRRGSQNEETDILDGPQLQLPIAA